MRARGALAGQLRMGACGLPEHGVHPFLLFNPIKMIEEPALNLTLNPALNLEIVNLLLFLH